ncbi:nucleoporin Nup186/Nup192/Nup205 [Geranomyces variabilis]|nr:nucleoporin Nup186/Nup192/Nup205 [Geranomyces variabilis]KAJ3143404.1 hypothetical protein HDU90_000164 [Geranomyces variabilis]
MSPTVASWQSELTRSFHDLLTTHLTSAADLLSCHDYRSLQRPTDAHELKTLKKTLAALRLDFVTLFHSPANNAGHNASERADVLQGKVTINGKKQQANAEFGASVVFLSDFLGINEARAAAIFQTACEVRARYQGWSKIKVAVHLFHRDREYLVESLILMVTRFVPGKAADDVAKLIASFLGELLALPVSFPQKILESMKYLKDTRTAFVRDTSLNGSITSEKVRQLEVENDVFVIHADHLARERNRLGDLLYFTTCRWRLTSTETMKLIGILRAVEVVDVATVSMLCSLMINFDHLQVENPRLELKQGDFDRLQRELVLSPWQVPEMGHLAATQWTLFLNYCAHDAIDENVVDDEFRRLATENHDDVSRKWRDHIGGRRGVYAFIGTYILPFRKTRHEKAQTPATEEAIDIDPETRDAYTGQIERLTDGLIVFLRWALKDIKCRDEDSTRAADQLERKAAAQSLNGGHSINSRQRATEHASAVTIREQTAWESLLYLIMILYRDRPDAAVSFWADQADMDQPDDSYQTAEKQAFMRMAADVRTSRFLRAFIHMLASLATGSYSAYQVHLKLNAEPRDSMLGSVLWTTFFTSLNSAIDILGREHRDLPPHEVESIIAFLRLLRQVVKFSYSARRTLCDNQHLRAIHTLFWLLGSRVPVTLKAALLEAIAAFCIPLGSAYDIQLQVWAMLEQTQIVPTVKGTSGQPTRMFSASQTSVNALRDGNEGILYDLEEIESKNGTYPETMAFLHLLDVLLHGQNDVQMVSVFQTLGMPERRPGIRPYIKLIIDHIFGKIFFRRCDDTEERAEMISTCLRIFDRCLDLFDLGTLMAENTTDANGDEVEGMSLGVAGFGPQILHNAQVLGLHPAFEVVCSLLGKSKLTARIFDTVSIGVEAVNETANKESLCGKSVFLALRILLRVLQFQKAFLEILAPALLEVGAAEWIGLPSAMAGIDHLLSFRNTIVVNIAEYIMCVDDDIVLLSVKILGTLSQSAVYGAVDPAVGMNRLLTLLQSAPSAERIIGGFVKRLELEEDEAEFVPSSLEEAEGVEPGDVVSKAEADAAEELAILVAENWQSQPWPNPKAGVVHAVRIAILDLLLHNVSDAPLPTVAHFLLGYDSRPAPSRVTEEKYNCMHAVLGMIRVPREAGAGKADQVAIGCPIYRTHPRLAERCYRLVYQMCVDPTLSASTMLYLRNQEDFFYEQIRAMPVGRAEEAEEAEGAISGILARLLQRTWLMKAVALELHVTIAARQTWHTQRLIDLLYVHIPTPAGIPGRGGYAAGVGGRMIDGDDWARSSQRARGEQEFDVPLTKIMEILSTMNFDELHRGGYEQIATALFPDVNFEDFRPQGGPLYDLAAIHHHLTSAARGNLNSNGPETPRERAAEDVKRILDALLATNQDREIGAARWQCGQAWAQIVQVTLTGGFSLLPGETREGIIFDILAALLHKETTGRTSPPIAETMSRVVLEILDRMQKDRLYQSLLQTSTLQAEPSTIRLPTDTLLHAVLHGIMRGILMAGATLEMRGNLYISLVRFLQYTKPDELEMQSSPPVSAPVPGSPVNTDSAPTSATPAQQQPSIIPSRARLLQNIYMVLSNDGEKLFETICRDAADGSGVWNIVAFVALDAICELAAYSADTLGSTQSNFKPGGRIKSWVLEVLVHRNFLSQFVRALSREDDLALRGIDPRGTAGRFLAGEATMTDLSPGDLDDNGNDERGTLNAHLLFEMKMSFLLRLSFQREGAHKLLEYGIVEALSECKFLDQRPEADGSYSGGDADAEERYHNALVPTLQLVLSVARQTQRENGTPSRIAAFVGAHQHVLVAILRDVPRVVTLATLRQVELATALFAYLAADGADSAAASIVKDGLPEAGHATFHDLLLALLNRHIAATPVWTTRLAPSSKAEEEMDRTKVVFLGRASNTTSKFRHEADRIAMDIVRNLLSYAVAVSEGGGGAAPARDDRHSRVKRPSAMPLFRFSFIEEKDAGASFASSMRASISTNVATSGVTLNAATTPSLAIICQFTSRTIDNLARAVEDHRNVNLKIADLHRLSIDEIQNIIANVKHLANVDGGDGDEEPLDDSAADLRSSRGNDALPPAQKRQLALVALHQHRADMVRLVAALLYLVEHLLLLLWRHLVYMQINSAANAVPVPFVGGGEKRASAVASTVSPLLNKLQSLDFGDAAGGPAVDGAGDARKMFLMMLTRQLGEIVQVL